MIRYNISEAIMFFLLLAGIVLTVITIRRMNSGQLALPRWAKVLLSAAMILGLTVTLIGMLPPIQADVDNPDDTVIVNPADPSKTTAPD